MNNVFKRLDLEQLRIESEQFILTQEQARELDARYADFLAHPAEGEPWLAVKSQILQPR